MTAVTVALIVLVGDQVTKFLATSGIIRAGWIEPGLNPDLALGVLGGPSAFEIVGAGVALMAATHVLRRARPNAVSAIALGLIVGGSLGNLADRVAYGAVRDFLIGPAVLFNLADVALMLGLAACAVALVGTRRQVSDT